MKFIDNRAVWTVAVASALAFSNTTWAKMHASPSPSGGQPESSSISSPQLNASERNFLQTAAEISAAEVQMGQLAQKQSSDPNIQKIGQDLEKDHKDALQQLQKLASSKGVNIVAQPTSIQEKRIQSLQSKSGNDFNKQFLRQNIIGHERAISLFERVSRRATDPDVKAWASQMVPQLKEHLAMVRTGKPEAVAEKTKPYQSPGQSQTHKPGQLHKSSPSGSPSGGGY